MWTELEPMIRPLTKEEVAAHRDRPHIKGDRDVDSWQGKKRILWLNSKVRDGAFYSPLWAVARYNNKWYRINGGHSSAMLSMLGDHLPKGKHVLYLRFDCETERDMADLFDQFDSNKSRRTFADKARAHASVHNNIADVAATWINNIVSGICFYLNDGVSKKTDEDTRVQMIHDEAPYIEWASQFAKKRVLNNNGVMAAMYRAYCGSELLATEFFSAVMEESASTPDHPTRVLRKDLEKSIAVSRKDKSSVQHSSRARYARTIHAWNAWQRGESVNMLKYFADAPIPSMHIIKPDGKRISI